MDTPIPPDIGPEPLSDTELEILDLDPFETRPFHERTVEAAESIETPVASFRITDDNLAEWAFRKLRALTRRKTAAAEQAETWKAGIDAWFEEVSRPLDRRISFFEAHLLAYARRTLSDEEKSRKLPSGRLWSRTATKPSIEITDPEHLTGWAEARFVDNLAQYLRPQLKAAGLSDEAIEKLPEAVRAAVGHAYDDGLLKIDIGVAKGVLNKVADVKETGDDPEDGPALGVFVDGEFVAGAEGRKAETNYGIDL